MNKALIIVDMQNDFVTGPLPVPNVKEIIPIIVWIANNVKYKLVVQAFDWHPKNNISFKEWPEHCIQDSFGSQSVLSFSRNALHNPNLFIYKGQDIDIDSYSAFFDNNHKKATGLEYELAITNIDELDIVGVATDYCVKFTAIDAVKVGYKTNVLLFACRGITPETTNEAIQKMKDCNINIL